MSPRYLQSRQLGFTLVELMVSMAIGMVIALALLTLLVNVNRNNAEMSRTNSVIENGRVSLQLLEGDISHAGFWGGYVPSFDDPNYTGNVGSINCMGDASCGSKTIVAMPNGSSAVPDPCASTPGWFADQNYRARLIAIPVQVYQIPSSGVSPICTGLNGFITNAQPNTDILVVRHAAPCQAKAAAADSDCKYDPTSGDMYFQYSSCSTDSVNVVLTSTIADLSLKPGTCTGQAPVYKFTSTVYWVRNYFLQTGDGIPTLVRTRFQPVTTGGVTTLKHQSTEALVDGIQAFRMELGVDNVSKPNVAGGTGNTLTAVDFAGAVTYASATQYYTPTNRGDGNADTYIACSTDPSARCQDAFYLANTVAVKVHLLVRANTKTPGFTDNKQYKVAGTTLGPFTDGYKRHVYTETVRLNNISMRREVPPV